MEGRKMPSNLIDFKFHVSDLEIQEAIRKIQKASEAMVNFGKALHVAWYKQLKDSGLISPCRYL